MTSLADIIIPLAGSIGNEKALAMRMACDGLEARIDDLEREAGMNLHASKLLADRIDALESSMSKVRERTYEIVREEMALVRSAEGPHAIARMHGLLLGESYGKLSEDQVAVNAARATTNTGEGGFIRKDDRTTALAVGVEVPACDGPATPSPAPSASATTNTGDSASSGSASGRTPELNAESPATSASEIPAWVPSKEECWSAFVIARRESLYGHDNTHEAVDAVRRLIASRAPRASTRRLSGHCPYCSWMGSPRSTIAEIDADAISHAETCAVHPRRELERRIAELENAPRASTVSVEEMAERLYEANRALPTWERNPSTCELTQKARDYFRSLARSALSALPARQIADMTNVYVCQQCGKAGQVDRALPASEERPRLSDRYRLCSKCAAPDAEEISASEAPQPASTTAKVNFNATPGGVHVVEVLSDATQRDVAFIAWDVLDAMRAHVKPQPSRAAQPAPASTPPIRAVAGTSLACAKCGCRWKRHADGSFQLYDADQRPCVECDNAPNAPLRPETPDDAPASTPDEGEVADIRSAFGEGCRAGWSMCSARIDIFNGPEEILKCWDVSVSKARALRLSSSRTPRVDVRRLVRDYHTFISDEGTEGRLVSDMTAALKAQGVECVGEKESAE